MGGVWAGDGDPDDFQVETTGQTAQRSSFGDAGLPGRVVHVPVSMTDTAVQVDFKHSVTPGPELSTIRSGVVARRVDANNFVYFSVSPGFSQTTARFSKFVAGVLMDVAMVNAPMLLANTYYSLRLLVGASGRYFCWYWPTGGPPGSPIIVGHDAALATGGTHASGRPGLLDNYVSGSQSVTRNYNNFLASVPILDAVLYPNQSAELRTTGMIREDTGGTSYARVESVVGCLPRLPPSGLENRKVELYVKGSRGDFDQIADTGIDDISVQVHYRPRGC